jgi:hypothetical protein
VAHQNVTKLNGNEYTTSMIGMKFKLAHWRADKGLEREAAVNEAKPDALDVSGGGPHHLGVHRRNLLTSMPEPRR